MMNLNDYEIFHKNKSSMQELSKDDRSADRIQHMTNSLLPAVNFDMVKRSYTNGLGLSEDHAASVDGLACTADSVVFLEFKNGKVSNRDVKNKIRDSLLIFCDITKKDVSYTRHNMDFVLIYNEAVNRLPNQLGKNVVQDSPSRTAISKRIAQMGNQELILFGLERYKKLYFREVHTYTKGEFEDYLNKLEEGRTH